MKNIRRSSDGFSGGLECLSGGTVPGTEEAMAGVSGYPGLPAIPGKNWSGIITGMVFCCVSAIC